MEEELDPPGDPLLVAAAGAVEEIVMLVVPADNVDTAAVVLG